MDLLALRGSGFVSRVSSRVDAAWATDLNGQLHGWARFGITKWNRDAGSDVVFLTKT